MTKSAGRHLPRWRYLLLGICVLGMLCALGGCKKDDGYQTDFPLEEETVIDMLEQAGLSGAISQDETYSEQDGHISYVIRSETEYYEGTENPVLVANVSSVSHDDQRALFTIFDQAVSADQIQWEDWKQQILFAALLYGGFEQAEELYQALLEQQLPQDETSFTLEVQLPEGYCTVSYLPRSQTSYDEDLVPGQKQSATLRVHIYQSAQLYQELAQA